MRRGVKVEGIRQRCSHSSLPVRVSHSLAQGRQEIHMPVPLETEGRKEMVEVGAYRMTPSRDDIREHASPDGDKDE
jgi:hypothetical protein